MSAVFTLSLFADSRYLQQCNEGQNVNKMTLYWLCVSALIRMCVRVLKGQHAGFKLPWLMSVKSSFHCDFSSRISACSRWEQSSDSLFICLSFQPLSTVHFTRLAPPVASCSTAHEGNRGWRDMRELSKRQCSFLLPFKDPDISYSKLKLNFERWIWILRNECNDV